MNRPETPGKSSAPEPILMGWPRQLDERDGRILYAMRSYQIIEMALKVYLSGRRAGLTEDAQTVPPEIARLPLAYLIKRFSKVNDNTTLHQQLADIVDDRNLVAHQALTTDDPAIAAMLGVMALELPRIREIDRRACRAMSALILEFIKTTPPPLPNV